MDWADDWWKDPLTKLKQKKIFTEHKQQFPEYHTEQ